MAGFGGGISTHERDNDAPAALDAGALAEALATLAAEVRKGLIPIEGVGVGV